MEGGNEMSKSLFHVILFNRKTETIDFKAYIPARNNQEAAMVAAQIYGEYKSETHLTIIKPIDGSDYDKE